MATVTGMTAEKITTLVGDSVTSASIDATTGNLVLQTRDGQSIIAGSVGSTHDAVDKAYPIGSIFMSTIVTNPATQLGVGTWAAWGTGRVPVGVDTTQTEFDTVNKTGGEKTHILTLSEMPLHNHDGAPHTHPINHDHDDGSKSFQYSTNTAQAGTATRLTDIGNVTGGGGTSAVFTFNVPAYSGSSGDAAFTAKTGLAGGMGGGHNNLQPYITCYMWRRTA